MRPVDRVQAVVASGFSERQAQFLVAVMLHAGVCVSRQYCTHRGVVRGQRQHDFFRSLVTRRIATQYPSAHRRAHLYHIHAKPLYRAIGEPDSRHRRPTTLARAVERLMVLDGVLASPEVQWFGAAADKVAHFTGEPGLRHDELPRLTFGTGARRRVQLFPDKLPIGLAPNLRRHVFLYGVTREAPMELRAFLRRHASLFRAVPEWEVRMLFPRHLAKAAPNHERVAHDELARPLHLDAVEQLRRYFTWRQQVEHGGVPADPAEFARLQARFRAPRFWALYRTFQQEGDAALRGLSSAVLADAMERERGLVTSHVLPHAYQHLASLVGTA